MQTLLKRSVDDQQVHGELFAIWSDRQRETNYPKIHLTLVRMTFINGGSKQMSRTQGERNFLQVLWECKLTQPQCSNGESSRS